MMKDKVIMITGASKGLGKALALQFAKEGAKLSICARNIAPLRKVEEEIKAIGAEVIAIEADVSIASDVDRFVSITEEMVGNVDCLINNASIFGPGPTLLADYPDAEFEKVLAVNIINPFLVTKRVLPGMLQKRNGAIINLTSEAGRTGYSEWGAYGISKFAVEGLTQTWADELDGTGVRINLVDPGEMDTEMHKTALPDCDYRLAQPGDHMDVFMYLASSSSDGINGKRFEAQEFTWNSGEHHA